MSIEGKMNNQLNPKRGLSDEVIKLVKNFYFRSDIVYTAPGLKDNIVVWAGGKKQCLRKHYLTMFLRETYALFKLEYPDEQISFSKFSSLRPANVLLLKNAPCDQCLCKIHENFRLKLKGLSVNYDNSWWEQYLCNSNNLNSECWKGLCTNCKDGKKFSVPCNPEEAVTWKEWKTDTTGRLTIKINEGCVAELHSHITESFAQMLEHTRVKRIQAAAFEEDKKNCRILQVDFAMAYSCEYQNEIQTALWHRQTVQLFTAAVFENGSCKSYLVCSDTADKGKDTVFTFITTLYDVIFKDMPADSKLNIIYSDGPSSEFKNRFMVKLLYILSVKYKVDFQWKYFATSHGKGVVDGIGGRAKSLVRQKCMSKSETIIVQSSQEFVSIANELMPKTSVIHISNANINKKILAENPWNVVPKIDGIQRMHVIQVEHKSNEINLWHVQENKQPDIIIKNYCQSQDSTDHAKIKLIPGNWCVVLYDNNIFPGEVLSVSMNDVKVSVMVKSGKHWKWPEHPDVLSYNFIDVIKKVSPPVVAGSRGQFLFQDIFDDRK